MAEAGRNSRLLVSAVAAPLLGVAAALAVRFALPDDMLPIFASLAAKIWIAAGVIGAFCVQLMAQLLTLSDDKALTSSEIVRLGALIDHRLRFLALLILVALLSLIAGIVAGVLADQDAPHKRAAIALAFGLLVWTAGLTVQVRGLVLEIRRFRTRLAYERAEAEARKASAADYAAIPPRSKSAA